MNEYVIRNANILDGTKDMEVMTGMDIHVINGVIREIGKNLPEHGETLELAGAYIIPGLINMHVHLPGSGKVGGKKVSDLKGLVNFIKKNGLLREVGMEITASGARKELYSGVTTVRSVGGVGDIDSRLAHRIAIGMRKGPRIIPANEAICTPGGHMEGTVSVAASTVEEAVKMVDQIADSGAALIKLMITGGVLDCKVKGHPGELKMSREMVKACCDRAHMLGLQVAAHVEGPEGVEIAAECGVDTIEHGALASDEAIALMKEHGSALICTLSPAVPLSLLDPSVTGYGEDCQYNSRVLMEGMVAMIEKCLKAGVKVGLGTDTGCPFVTHYDMWRELFYFTKMIKGTDNRMALYMATLGNAEIMGYDQKFGSIAEGKSADMVILSGNPLEDLTVLRDPKMVIQSGIQYTKKNKKYGNIETVLDELMKQL